MRAEIHPYCLPLKRPWVAASSILTERRGALLHLIDDDGVEGWGDCAPLPSGGPVEPVLEALDTWTRRPASADFCELPPEARWAVESAQADLAARRAGLPLWRHLGGMHDSVEVNAALGPLDDELPARLAAAHAQGFRIGKIKVGLAPVAEEVARLKALDAGLRLRLDANRAWNEAEARHFLHAIAELPIDAVEEPLVAPTLDRLAALQAELPFALTIDESLPAFGIDAIVATGAVHRLVLKPARLGGIAATQAVARQAQAAGIEVVLTSVIDSAVGVAATAHLAAALSPKLAHGLGTGNWLAVDVAAALSVTDGTMQFADVCGHGILP